METGNDSTPRSGNTDLVGVSALAKAIGREKGTISKHAAAGKIPVADRDAKGAPLFDVAAVKAAYENNINPLMRRQGEAVEAHDATLDLDEAADDQADGERRSVTAAPPAGGLLQEQVVERQLRNRRLVRQIGQDEGRLVLGDVVAEEQETMARRTRDAVTGSLADKAGEAYAFAKTTRTESEWRVWLSERGREAFNNFASTLALEDDDEFDDEQQSVDGDPGQADAGRVP